MFNRDFPGCCTGSVITGLGACSTQDYQARGTNPVNLTDLQFAEALRQQLNNQRGSAFVSAVTTNEQEQANRVMLKMGWKKSKWLHKRQHSETQVRLWYWPIMDGIPSFTDLAEIFK